MTLLERLHDHAQHTPDKTAVREIARTPNVRRDITYRALAEHVSCVAARLRRELTPGAVVMVCCPNVIEFHVAFLAILSADLIAFPVSAEINEVELLTAARESAAVGVIGSRRAARALADHLQIRIDVDEVLSIHESPNRFGNTPNAGLYLQSSGTTGRPKIVHRSSAALDAVSANIVRAIDLNGDDRLLATVPLCHSYGLEHGLLSPIFAGSTVHLCRGFDLNVVLAELTMQGITVFPGVPSMFEMIAAMAGEMSRFASMRFAYSAGAVLPRSVFDSLERKVGIRVGQIYGATELGSVTFSDPRSPRFEPASVGQPMNGVRIRIDDDHQICIAAPSMLSRYVGHADLPLHKEHFLTGDLGQIDAQGNLVITGRLKLLIDVGGLKVNPFEVEDVLAQHADVSACVVVPLRLSETVFRVKAIVTPRDPSRPPDVEDLRRFARSRLTAYKVPRVFEIRDSLPRSATGKILRSRVEAT